MACSTKRMDSDGHGVRNEMGEPWTPSERVVLGHPWNMLGDGGRVAHWSHSCVCGISAWTAIPVDIGA